MHEGEITVTSTDGKDTEFKITLPIKVKYKITGNISKISPPRTYIVLFLYKKNVF